MPKQIKREYEPKTLEEKLAYLTGEAGEALKEIGRIGRFGLEGVDPRLPKEKQVTNKQALFDELHDLERAIMYVRAELRLRGCG